MFYINKIYNKKTKEEYSRASILLDSTPLKNSDIVVRLSSNRKKSIEDIYNMLVGGESIVGVAQDANTNTLHLFALDRYDIEFMSKVRDIKAFQKDVDAANFLMTKGVGYLAVDKFLTYNIGLDLPNGLVPNGLSMRLMENVATNRKVTVGSSDSTVLIPRIIRMYLANCKEWFWKYRYIIVRNTLGRDCYIYCMDSSFNLGKWVGNEMRLLKC